MEHLIFLSWNASQFNNRNGLLARNEIYQLGPNNSGYNKETAWYCYSKCFLFFSPQAGIINTMLSRWHRKKNYHRGYNEMILWLSRCLHHMIHTCEDSIVLGHAIISPKITRISHWVRPVIFRQNIPYYFGKIDLKYM